MSRRQQRRRKSRRRDSQQQSLRRRGAAAAGIAVGAALVAPAAGQAAPATFHVTSTANTSGNCDATPTNCTLPQAIASANGNTNPGDVDHIVFDSAVTGTINLSGALAVTQDVYIGDRTASSPITLEAHTGDRIFNLNMGTDGQYVYLAGLEMKDASISGFGGAIYNKNASLYVYTSKFTDDHAARGGGIFSLYGASIGYSTFTGNTASNNGGAIKVSGDAPLSVFASTITGGTAHSSGGGVYSTSPTLIGGSTIDHNHADHQGGGIDFARIPEGASPALLASTVSGNTADGNGGGIYGYQYTPGSGTYNHPNVTLLDSTVAGNSGAAGGGLATYAYVSDTSYGYGAYLYNAIVGHNTSTTGAADLDATAGGLGTAYTPSAVFSLVQDGTTGISSYASIFGQDPQLGPLANNGGTTQTMAPNPTSPALDSGYSVNLVDQAGQPRPVDLPTIANAPASDGSDMGAFEVQSLPAPPTSSTGPPILPAAPQLPVLGAGAITTTSKGFSVTVTCGAVGPCVGGVVGTAAEITQGGKIVKVTSARKKSKKKRKKVTVGSKSFTVPANQSLKVTVPLNATGKKLLKKFGKLPITVTVTQNVGGNSVVTKSAKVSIRAKKKHHARHKVLAAGTRRARMRANVEQSLARFYARKPFKRFIARHPRAARYVLHLRSLRR